VLVLQVESRELGGRSYISVPGYQDKVAFGELVHFAYLTEDSGGFLISVLSNCLVEWAPGVSDTVLSPSGTGWDTLSFPPLGLSGTVGQTLSFSPPPLGLGGTVGQTLSFPPSGTGWDSGSDTVLSPLWDWVGQWVIPGAWG